MSKRNQHQVLRQCVGIDVSKKSLSVCMGKLDEQWQVVLSQVEEFSNDKKGFNQLTKWVKGQLSKQVEVVYLMEATGVYHESLAYHLHKIKKQVHVVLPNKAKHYLSSLNAKSKTDRVDARGLAQFGLERKLSPWQPPKAIYKQLRELTRHRASLQQSKVSLLNQLSAFESGQEGLSIIKRSLKRLVKKIEEEMERCEKEVKKRIEGEEELKAKIKKLLTITGVGLLTAATVVAETGGFDRFKSIKQLISYAGMDVVQRQSGSSVKGKTKISKKGNRHIRAMLYFPAMSAVQHNTEMKNKYQALLAKGKPRMVALVAIQHKILSLLFTLWKQDSCYIEHYQLQKQLQQQAKNNKKIALAQS